MGQNDPKGFQVCSWMSVARTVVEQSSGILDVGPRHFADHRSRSLPPPQFARKSLQAILTAFKSIPDAPCMPYMPTLTPKIPQLMSVYGSPMGRVWACQPRPKHNVGLSKGGFATAAEATSTNPRQQSASTGSNFKDGVSSTALQENSMQVLAKRISCLIK